MSEHPYIANHLEALAADAGDRDAPLDWLASFQSAASERFSGAEVPNRKSEEWRFFDLRPIVDTTWDPSARGSDVELTFAAEAGMRLSLRGGADLEVDGATLPDGAYVGGLRDLPEGLRGTVADALGSAVAPYDDDLFCALNGAAFSDIATVVVPADASIEEPIHVAFAAPTTDGALHTTRLLVVAGRGSKFTVVEDYASNASSRHLTNAVTEVVVGANANVSHVRVQREGANALHVGRTGARVGAAARYDSVSVTVGGASARNDVWVTHEGDGGWSRIDGLAIVDGKQEADTHSVIDNTRPHCESHQLHKCVVGDRGHAVFNGKIFVRKGAQRTDAYQLNRNLLLDAGSRVDTKPQLEIFADDVKCTHGATVGQLDEEQLFYLTSRGIEPDEAVATLTYAFAAEVIETISLPSLAAGLKNEAMQRTMEKGRRQ